VVKALSPFGGGLGSSGRTCGTLAGALAVLGTLMGKASAKERDDRLMWKLAHRLVKEFEGVTKEYGGIECRDIARIDWKDIKQVRAFYKEPDSRRKECFKVIERTVEILDELINEFYSQKEATK